MDKAAFEYIKTLTPRWVCNVVRSGYHNGAYCTPADPHDPSWGCAHRLEISLKDTEGTRLFFESHGFTIAETETIS